MDFLVYFFDMFDEIFMDDGFIGGVVEVFGEAPVCL